MTLYTVVEKETGDIMTTNETYKLIGSVEELKWFFDHVIQKPNVNESYSMVFVSRRKKLNEEERKALGMAANETEFLSTQSLRLGKYHNQADLESKPVWTFEKFLQHVYRFEVNKNAYLTTGGQPLPQKSLVVIFYVNPCDDMKVADEMIKKIADTKTAICKAMLNGKQLDSNLQSYQVFGNLESSIKHLKANCKGTNYWLDYDVDVPAWFKEGRVEAGETVTPYQELTDVFDHYYGKGNYVVVDTGGGYHVLVRTFKIMFDPHKVCRDIEYIYERRVAQGAEPYVNEKGECKFEAIVNDSQIPGIPLPGTLQYGRLVTVLNKEDFD